MRLRLIAQIVICFTMRARGAIHSVTVAVASVTAAKGRSCIYVPVKVDGRVEHF